jgi:hypothetical protein
MKDTPSSKQFIAIGAGIGFGWLVIHLLVTHWQKIKAFASSVFG